MKSYRKLFIPHLTKCRWSEIMDQRTYRFQTIQSYRACQMDNSISKTLLFDNRQFESKRHSVFLEDDSKYIVFLWTSCSLLCYHVWISWKVRWQYSIDHSRARATLRGVQSYSYVQRRVFSVWWWIFINKILNLFLFVMLKIISSVFALVYSIYMNYSYISIRQLLDYCPIL